MQCSSCVEEEEGIEKRGEENKRAAAAAAAAAAAYGPYGSPLSFFLSFFLTPSVCSGPKRLRERERKKQQVQLVVVILYIAFPPPFAYRPFFFF